MKLGSPEWFRYGSYVVVRIAFYPPSREGRTREQLEGILQTMVDNGLRVRLATQGLTGIKSLNGDVLDPKRYPAFEAKWKPDYFHIPSAPSTFASIEKSLDTLTKKLQAVDFDKLFQDVDNLVNTTVNAVNDLHTESLSRELQGVLTDFRRAVQRVDAILDNPSINAMLADASELTKTLNTQVNTGEIKSTLVNVDSASKDLPRLVAHLNRMLRTLDNLVSSQSRDVAETLANLRLASENFRQLTDTVKRYPSYGLFGKPPVKSTPGNHR